jgi:hypothetical protein
MDAEQGLVALVGKLYAPAASTIAALAFRRNAGLNFQCIVVGILLKRHARIIEPQCPLPFKSHWTSPDSPVPAAKLTS